MTIGRSIWNGTLSWGSAMTVNVKLYTANDSSAERKLRTIHATCGTPIKQPTTCPACNVEVGTDELGKGVETKTQGCIALDTNQLADLEYEKQPTLEIQQFFPSGNVTSRELSGEFHYFLPADPGAQPGYALLAALLQEYELEGLVHRISGKRRVSAILQPRHDPETGRILLAIAQLKPANHLKAERNFAEQLRDVEIPASALKISTQILRVMTAKSFDPGSQRDDVTDRLNALIDESIESAPAAAPQGAEVINLMDALKQSVKDAKLKQAPSRRKAVKKRRKSS